MLPPWFPQPTCLPALFVDGDGTRAPAARRSDTCGPVKGEGEATSPSSPCAQHIPMFGLIPALWTLAGTTSYFHTHTPYTSAGSTHLPRLTGPDLPLGLVVSLTGSRSGVKSTTITTTTTTAAAGTPPSPPTNSGDGPVRWRGKTQAEKCRQVSSTETASCMLRRPGGSPGN